MKKYFSHAASAGSYEQKDDHNHIKHTGKYIVVLKQENGEWEFYRDNGL
jgi:hypothetical protein